MRICPTLLSLAFFVLGCSSATSKLDAAKITDDELLGGSRLGLTPGQLQLIDDQDVLAVSDEMRSFLSTHVDSNSSAYIRFRQLSYAIISKGTFGLEYDEKTRTAAETFRLRQGNCLSFSNMFVAMARHIGLDVQYQEVDIPPDWTFRNDAFVLNRHVNVLVDLGTSGRHTVDFNLEDFRTSYDRRAIPEMRALAHFYNNLGVESMQAGDTASALGYFRRAIAEHDRRFIPAWTNLGILYLREGHPECAEAAFLHALQVNSRDLVAMSNLVEFYELQGDKEQAEEYRKRVSLHRKKNPYYRYYLAREAFFARDFDTAIHNLKYATAKRPNEDQFFFLLGLSFLQKGDEKAARRWLDKAENIAASDSMKRNYSNKIDLLLSTTE